jgi:branched-chain amino acid transport system permease protein
LILGARRAHAAAAKPDAYRGAGAARACFIPLYRVVIILATLAVALLLYVLVMRTRVGMLIRAGASNREMVGALGVNIKLLYTLVFGLGAALAGFAGLMQAPILTVQIGMG